MPLYPVYEAELKLPFFFNSQKRSILSFLTLHLLKMIKFCFLYMFGTLVAYPVGENERIQMVKNKRKAQLQSLEKTRKRLAGFVSAFRARNALLGRVLERWGCQDQRGSGPATCLVGGQAGQHGICPTTPPLGISGMHAHIPGCPGPYWAHSARGLGISSLVWVQVYSFQGPFQGGICEESSKLHRKYLIFVAFSCFFFKMD